MNGKANDLVEEEEEVAENKWLKGEGGRKKEKYIL